MGGGLGGESRIPRHSGRLLEAWQKPRRRAAGPHSAAGGAERPHENLEPRPADRPDQEAGAPRSYRKKIAMLGPILLALRSPSDFLRAAPHNPGAEAVDVRLSGPPPPSAKVDPVHSLTGLGKPCLGYVTADAVTPMLLNFRRYSETFIRPAIWWRPGENGQAIRPSGWGDCSYPWSVIGACRLSHLPLRYVPILRSPRTHP